MNTLDPTVWENRRTTRLFSEENKTIPDEDLKYLATVINNIPSQCSIKSQFWLYLGQSEEDMNIRKWMADNIYWMPDDRDESENPRRETMLGIIQAPAILTCVRTSSPWANPETGKSADDHEQLADRSEGFFAGAILATLLNMGYKVATFGCTAGASALGRENRLAIYDEYTRVIKEKHSNELQEMIDKFPGPSGNWKDIQFFPGVTQCFGAESIDETVEWNGKYDTWTEPGGKEYNFVNGIKTRTPVDTCVGF